MVSRPFCARRHLINNSLKCKFALAILSLKHVGLRGNEILISDLVRRRLILIETKLAQISAGGQGGPHPIYHCYGLVRRPPEESTATSCQGLGQRAGGCAPKCTSILFAPDNRILQPTNRGTVRAHTASPSTVISMLLPGHIIVDISAHRHTRDKIFGIRLSM